MDGKPRVCHPGCGDHQKVIVNGEETAGHLTGDCLDVARPPRLAASFLYQVLEITSAGVLGTAADDSGSRHPSLPRPIQTLLTMNS